MSFFPAAGHLIGTIVVAKVATDISKNIGRTPMKKKGGHKIVKASKPKKTLYGGKALGATKRKRRAQGKVFSSHDKDPSVFG